MREVRATFGKGRVRARIAEERGCAANAPATAGKLGGNLYI